MVLIKIESKVLSKALKMKEFGCLRMYIGEFYREDEDVFVSSLNKYSGYRSILLNDALDDYFFNVNEEFDGENPWKIFDLGKELLGEDKYDFKILKVVQI